MIDVAARVKALRAARGFTQEQLAHAGGLERVEIVSIETGRNQAGTARIRKALARGARVGLDEMFRYLDGEIELDELLRSAPSTPRPPSQSPYPNRDSAIWILREASFSASAIEALEAETPERDRTIYAWIKRAEALASEAPPPPPQKPTTPPATPPTSTRRSRH